MRTVLLLLALASAACGSPPPLPNPTSRAEACARINGANAIAAEQFCRVGGAPCHQYSPSRPMQCLTPVAGEQSVCLSFVPENFPSRTCDTDPTRCPVGWECRAFMHPAFAGPTHWCFPGPPCDSTADAGVDGG